MSEDAGIEPRTVAITALAVGNIVMNAHSCFIFSAELRSSSSHSNLSSNIEDLLSSGPLFNS